jgi:hypothetical protein
LNFVHSLLTKFNPTQPDKISMTLGFLIIICYIVQLFIFIFTFLSSVTFQNVNFKKIFIENTKYLLFVRVLLSFPWFLSIEAAILHKVKSYLLTNLLKYFIKYILHIKVHLYFSEDNCLIRFNAKILLFLGIYGVWSIKYEK